jgi:hypothetical protein
MVITFPYPINNGKFYELPTFTVTVSGTDANGKPSSKCWEVYRFGIYNNDGSVPQYRSRGLFVAGLADDQTYAIDRFDPAYSVHSASSVETGAWHVKDNFLIHDGPDIPATRTNPVADGLYASIGCLEICGGPAGFDAFNDFIISLSGSTKSRKDALVEIGAARIIEIHYLAAKRPPLKEYIP